MAITTYALLKTAVANWLGRTDLTSYIPNFIAIAEEEISSQLRSEVTRDDLTLDSAAVALPADCAELRSIRYNTATLNGVINITTDVGLADLRISGSGIPTYAAVINNVLLLNITPADDYVTEITYFNKLVALAADGDTIDTNLQRIYLFGALVEAEMFLEHDEKAALWGARFAKAIQDENVRRERAELAAAPMVRRLPVVFG